MKQFFRFLIAPFLMRKFETEAIRKAYWMLDAADPKDMRLMSDKYRVMSILTKELARRKEEI